LREGRLFPGRKVWLSRWGKGWWGGGGARGTDQPRGGGGGGNVVKQRCSGGLMPQPRSQTYRSGFGGNRGGGLFFFPWGWGTFFVFFPRNFSGKGGARSRGSAFFPNQKGPGAPGPVFRHPEENVFPARGARNFRSFDCCWPAPQRLRDFSGFVAEKAVVLLRIPRFNNHFGESPKSGRGKGWILYV